MTSYLYTRTGDKGSTSLCDGSRVSKDAPRVEAYGALDETNSWVGAALASVEDPLLHNILQFLMHRLYNCSSNLAVPPTADMEPVSIAEQDARFLEQAIDLLGTKTAPLSGFVLPGGTRAAGMLHVARTVCRRAERRVLSLKRTEPVDDEVLRFVNRASDLLFAAARYANAIDANGDITWNREFPIPDLDNP